VSCRIGTTCQHRFFTINPTGDAPQRFGILRECLVQNHFDCLRTLSQGGSLYSNRVSLVGTVPASVIVMAQDGGTISASLPTSLSSLLPSSSPSPLDDALSSLSPVGLSALSPSSTPLLQSSITMTPPSLPTVTPQPSPIMPGVLGRLLVFCFQAIPGFLYWVITFTTITLPTGLFTLFSTSLTFTMNFTTLYVIPSRQLEMTNRGKNQLIQTDY
jgi:hypothetical protein